MIKVLCPGSEVIIGPNVVGCIGSVQITSRTEVNYQVIWWVEQERREVWLRSFEVSPLDDPKELEVGFHTIHSGERNGQQGTNQAN
jgi:hypothetical protein